MDLVDVFIGHARKEESAIATSFGNQVIFVESMELVKRRTSNYWPKAHGYSVCNIATVISDESTTTAKATGLMAHMSLSPRYPKTTKIQMVPIWQRIPGVGSNTQTRVWGTLNIRFIRWPSIQVDTSASKGTNNKSIRPRTKVCFYEEHVVGKNLNVSSTVKVSKK